MNREPAGCVDVGTPRDLLRAAELGARLECRRRRARGEDDDAVRATILGRLRRELDAGSFGDYADESLVAAVQRAIEAILAEPRRSPITPLAN